MKSICKRFLLTLVMTSILGFPNITSAADQPLIIEDPWPPYTYGEFGPPEGGVAVEITKTIFRKIGLEPRLALFPWKRVLKMAEHGDADGIMLLMKTKEREEYLVYTDKLFTNRDRIYANSDTIKTAPVSLMDLSEYRFGYVMGYVYGGAVDEFLSHPGPNKVHAYRSLDNIELMINKRIDFIIATKPVVDNALNTNPSWVGKIHETDIHLEAYHYYMALSKKSKFVTYVNQINQAIAEMKRDGTMDRLAAGGRSD